MARTHRIVFGIAIAGYLTAVGMTRAHASNHDLPSPSEIAFASEVSNLLFNELVAALFTEFNETTAANVEHGKQAISLIFNDRNRDIRLIGAFGPLLGGANNRPDDRFERTALRRALDGGTAYTDVQKIDDRWYYRRSVPLTNTMHAACVLCHSNFTPDVIGPTGDGQWVGALVMSVPIRTN